MAISPQQMAMMAKYLRGVQPPPVTQPPPVALPTPTPAGADIWKSTMGPGSNDYGQQWLMGQLRGGAPGGPGGGAPPAGPPPGGAGGPSTAGPPAPMQGPPEAPLPPSPDPSTLDQITPEMAQQLMSLGDKERQMALAEKMRDQENATGRTVNNGRSYVGASLGEHAVKAYQRFKGGRDAKRIGREQTEGRMSILDLLRKNQ